MIASISRLQLVLLILQYNTSILRSCKGQKANEVFYFTALYVTDQRFSPAFSVVPHCYVGNRQPYTEYLKKKKKREFTTPLCYFLSWLITATVKTNKQKPIHASFPLRPCLTRSASHSLVRCLCSLNKILSHQAQQRCLEITPTCYQIHPPLVSIMTATLLNFKLLEEKNTLLIFSGRHGGPSRTWGMQYFPPFARYSAREQNKLGNVSELQSSPGVCTAFWGHLKRTPDFC